MTGAAVHLALRNRLLGDKIHLIAADGRRTGAAAAGIAR